MPPAAIEAFLGRPRDNAALAKKWTDQELEKHRAGLEVSPPIWNKLHRLQKVCFILGVYCNRFLMLNDMGTGKTILSIALARYFGKLGVANRVLCLVPNLTNKGEWADQIREHSPGSTFVILQGSSEQKWRQLESTDSRFILETFGGFIRMVCKLQEVKRRGRKKPVPKLVPNLILIRKFFRHVDAVFADEPTGEISSKSSLGWRVLHRVLMTDCPDMPFFALTGTPFGKDPTTIWGLSNLVDGGYSLGETLGLFRSTFFTEKIGYAGQPVYTFDKSTDMELHRCLAHRSIRIVNDEGRPGVNRHIKRAVLADTAEAYYNEAVMQLRKARGNAAACKNPFLSMRQISSGFVGYKDDETGEKAQFWFPENPKMDLLMSSVRGIAYEYKVIIFYEFTVSGLRIMDELKKLGRTMDIGTPMMLYGGTKDPIAIRDRYRDPARKDDRILVMQSRFGRGLNFQIAKWGIFYEQPVSVMLRQQCERRWDRQYSPHKSVGLLDCITKDTADEGILRSYQIGKDIFAAVVDGSFRPDLVRR